MPHDVLISLGKDPLYLFLMLRMDLKSPVKLLYLVSHRETPNLCPTSFAGSTFSLSQLPRCIEFIITSESCYLLLSISRDTFRFPLYS